MGQAGFRHGLLAQEHSGQGIELLLVGSQQIMDQFMLLSQQILNGGIDSGGGGVGIGSSLGQLIAQERLGLIQVECGQPDLAHAPAGDHAAGQPRRLDQVIFGPGGDVADGDLLSRTPAEEHSQPGQQVTIAQVVLVCLGPLFRHAQGASSGDDGDLVNGVGRRQEPGDERVAGFVVGNHPAILLV